MAMCTPPIPKLHFNNRTAVMDREFPFFWKGTFALLILGFSRSYLNASGLLDDFMSGGTDFFAGLLGLFAIYDCCTMNASFFVMFIVWSVTNAVFFDFLLSFLPNIFVNFSLYWTAPNPWVPYAFLLDNIIMLITCALQLKLSLQAKAMLDAGIPGWQNMVTWGTSQSQGGSVSQQPLLGQQVRTSATRPQAMGNSFQAFSGGGQRLGGSGP